MLTIRDRDQMRLLRKLLGALANRSDTFPLTLRNEGEMIRAVMRRKRSNQVRAFTKDGKPCLSIRVKGEDIVFM